MSCSILSCPVCFLKPNLSVFAACCPGCSYRVGFCPFSSHRLEVSSRHQQLAADRSANRTTSLGKEGRLQRRLPYQPCTLLPWCPPGHDPRLVHHPQQSRAHLDTKRDNSKGCAWVHLQTTLTCNLSVLFAEGATAALLPWRSRPAVCSTASSPQYASYVPNRATAQYR